LNKRRAEREDLFIDGGSGKMFISAFTSSISAGVA
jgi:hypothetical protein